MNSLAALLFAGLLAVALFAVSCTKANSLFIRCPRVSLFFKFLTCGLLVIDSVPCAIFAFTLHFYLVEHALDTQGLTQGVWSIPALFIASVIRDLFVHGAFSAYLWQSTSKQRGWVIGSSALFFVFGSLGAGVALFAKSFIHASFVEVDDIQSWLAYIFLSFNFAANAVLGVGTTMQLFSRRSSPHGSLRGLVEHLSSTNLLATIFSLVPFVLIYKYTNCIAQIIFAAYCSASAVHLTCLLDYIRYHSDFERNEFILPVSSSFYNEKQQTPINYSMPERFRGLSYCTETDLSYEATVYGQDSHPSPTKSLKPSKSMPSLPGQLKRSVSDAAKSVADIVLPRPTPAFPTRMQSLNSKSDTSCGSSDHTGRPPPPAWAQHRRLGKSPSTTSLQGQLRRSVSSAARSVAEIVMPKAALPAATPTRRLSMYDPDLGANHDYFGTPF